MNQIISDESPVLVSQTQALPGPSDQFSMEIFRFNILPLEEIERREAFKEAVNNCPHCGSPLRFSVEIDFLRNTLQEDSVCQSCTVTVRTEFHPLQ